MRFYRYDDRPYSAIMKTGFKPGAYYTTGEKEVRNLFKYLLTYNQSLNHGEAYRNKKSVKQNRCMAQLYEVIEVKREEKPTWLLPKNPKEVSQIIVRFGQTGWQICPFFSTSLGSPKIASRKTLYYFDLNVNVYYIKNKTLCLLNGTTFPGSIKTGFVLDSSNLNLAKNLAYIHAGDQNSITNCEVSFFTPVAAKHISPMKRSKPAPKPIK